MKITDLPFILLLVGTSVFLGGCLDTIDLESPEGLEQALVIHGELILGAPSVANVSVSRLFDFTAQSRIPVSMRKVEVLDLDGNSVTLKETRPGEYTGEISATSGIDVKVGGEYFIRIEAIDGRVFESQSESMIQGDAIQGLWYEVTKEEIIGEFGDIDSVQKLQLYLSTTSIDPSTGEPTRLKWDVRRTYKITDSPIEPWVDPKVCYIDDNPQSDVQIADGVESGTQNIDSLQVLETVISSFYAEGAYLAVYQQAITPTTYGYWNEVRELRNRTGGMFEPVAGEIRTNMFNVNDRQDLVYGFFSCYIQDTARVYISPEGAGYPPKACPPFGGIVNLNGDCNVRVCCDCRDRPGSSVEKPSYWVE